jgi:hypothetical protein
MREREADPSPAGRTAGCALRTDSHGRRRFARFRPPDSRSLSKQADAAGAGVMRRSWRRTALRSGGAPAMYAMAQSLVGGAVTVDVRDAAHGCGLEAILFTLRLLHHRGRMGRPRPSFIRNAQPRDRRKAPDAVIISCITALLFYIASESLLLEGTELDFDSPSNPDGQCIHEQ